jgi:hypothetical protein
MQPSVPGWLRLVEEFRPRRDLPGRRAIGTVVGGGQMSWSM